MRVDCEVPKVVESYWGHIGKLYLLGSVLAFVAFIPMWYFDFFSFKSDPRTVIIRVFIYTLFVVGLVLFIAGKAGDRKLKKLKAIGRPFEPIKVIAQPGFMLRFSFEGKDYESFHVRCEIRDSKGNETIVKSRRLIVVQGMLRIIPQPANILCEAMVYFNPNKRGDFAVDVWLG
jgi:hypothetical protein